MPDCPPDNDGGARRPADFYCLALRALSPPGRRRHQHLVYWGHHRRSCRSKTAFFAAPSSRRLLCLYVRQCGWRLKGEGEPPRLSCPCCSAARALAFSQTANRRHSALRARKRERSCSMSSIGTGVRWSEVKSLYFCLKQLFSLPSGAPRASLAADGCALACLCPQYDLSTTTYSPDGKVFQIEYAQKAVDNSGRVSSAFRCGRQSRYDAAVAGTL